MTQGFGAGQTKVSIRALAEGEEAAVGAVLGLARLHQGDGLYLVAWADSDPVGHVHLALKDPPELQDLTVAKRYRRRGIARCLLAAAEADLRLRGCVTVRLEVSVNDEIARSLYLAFGYVDAGLPVRRVKGRIQLRTGPIEVDDNLITLEKGLEPGV